MTAYLMYYAKLNETVKLIVKTLRKIVAFKRHASQLHFRYKILKNHCKQTAPSFLTHYKQFSLKMKNKD